MSCRGQENKCLTCSCCGASCPHPHPHPHHSPGGRCHDTAALFWGGLHAAALAVVAHAKVVANLVGHGGCCSDGMLRVVLPRSRGCVSSREQKGVAPTSVSTVSQVNGVYGRAGILFPKSPPRDLWEDLLLKQTTENKGH